MRRISVTPQKAHAGVNANGIKYAGETEFIIVPEMARVLNAVPFCKEVPRIVGDKCNFEYGKLHHEKCLTGLTACGSAAVNGLLLCPLLGFSH